MKRNLILISLLLSARLFAQMGASFVPYFATTAYMTPLYKKETGFGNNAWGFSFVATALNKVDFEYRHFGIFQERKGNDEYPFFLNSGGIDSGYTHRDFRWNELRFDVSLTNWGTEYDDSKRTQARLSFRGGFIWNTRMCMLSPQYGRDSVYSGQHIVDSTVALSRFDVTAMRQKMFNFGFALKIFRIKELDRSGFLYEYDALGNVVGTTVSGGGTLERIRLWSIYGDLLLAASTKLDDYYAWTDYRNGRQLIAGGSVPDLGKIGWRVGIRRDGFNPFGIQLGLEFGRLPGQDVNKTTDQWRDPQYKNMYFMGGVSFCFGLFGD